MTIIPISAEYFMLLFNQLNRTMAHPYFLNFTSVITLLTGTLLTNKHSYKLADRDACQQYLLTENESFTADIKFKKFTKNFEIKILKICSTVLCILAHRTCVAKLRENWRKTVGGVAI